jgi:putative sterol carrier protein
MERRDPAQLAAMLAGIDDATVEEQVTAHGVDDVLAQVFDEMARRFLPEKAQGRTAVVLYEVGLRDGSVRSWQMVVAGGGCTVHPGADRDPQLTVQVALPRFLRLLSGSLDGIVALMRGELRLRGDLVLAQLMQSWFDRS